MKLTFCYRHIAPYHHARLVAVQHLAGVTVVEYGDVERMAFDEFEGARPYATVRVKAPENASMALSHELDKTSPDVLLLPGWGYSYTLTALRWALENAVPVVVISDSYELPQSSRWKEALKSRIVSLFSSGLVAGRRSREYLVKLGMQKDRIFEGCDVVDNKHFEEGAEAARGNAVRLREKLGLPQKFFLAVNRLAPEKNLLFLLQAYAGYRRAGAPEDWQLILVGAGKLKAEILRCMAELGIEPHVMLAGSKNYEELPSYYGLASAFILASTLEPWGLVVNEAMSAGLPVLVSDRCGCVAELVEEGSNGHTFDPYDIEKLTGHMLKVAGGEYDLTAMADACRKIISRWTVELCAENTRRAAEIALGVPRARTKIIDSLILMAANKKLSRNIHRC